MRTTQLLFMGIAVGALLAALGIILCSHRSAQADTNGPEGVRVQQYGNCLVFTHDTGGSGGGASIAVIRKDSCS